MKFNQKPVIADSAWVAPGACVIGKVTLGEESSVWYNAVIRGDSSTITIGRQTNIQDGTVIHTGKDRNGEFPCRIGEGSTVGHSAIIHGCTIGDNTLIGMGSIVMNGAKIGNNCIIGAGSLVTQGMVVPDGMMAFGSPAKVVRALKEAEIEQNRENCGSYLAAIRGMRE